MIPVQSLAVFAAVYGGKSVAKMVLFAGFGVFCRAFGRADQKSTAFGLDGPLAL